MNENSKHLIKAIKAHNKAIKRYHRNATHLNFLRLVDARLRLDVSMSNYKFANN